MTIDFIGDAKRPTSSFWRRLRTFKDPIQRKVAISAAAGMRRALAEEERAAFLWSPVGLCIGLAVYFSLAAEPSLPMASAPVLGAACLLAIGIRFQRVLVPAFLVLAICGGFALGSLRTALVATPSLIWTSPVVTLTGVIRHIEGEPVRRRLMVIDIEGVIGIRPDDVTGGKPLKRVRVSIGRAGGHLKAGERIRVKARLFPLNGPVIPGGYDFGRMQWFQGIGATGYSFGAVERLPFEPGFWQRLHIAIERLRDEIGSRIRAVLDGAVGGLAVALVNGDRSGIPAEVTQDFQISGLAHMISISGMHMSMIAGTTYWLLRALLALLPGAAVMLPVKKIAGLAALVTGSGYFLISGQDVAAQRSFIMIAIMLTAVLLDRPAISMRNVALSALIVLIFAPEAMLSASFHLSFLAVIALVAVFEAIHRHRAGKEEGIDPQSMSRRSSWPWRLAQIMAAMIAIDLVTTLVAGLATAPVAAFHFQRVSVYSLLANLLATPVVGLIVMPLLLVALMVMPLGLEAAPLEGAGLGIAMLIRIAGWVAELPGAVSIVPVQPLWAILLVVAGMLWLCLARTGLRFLGFAPMILGLILAPTAEKPDLLIDREGKIVALRNGEGALALSDGRRGSFSAKIWLARDGDDVSPAQAARRTGFTCDPQACLGELGASTEVALVRDRAALAEECARSRVVIAPFHIRGSCAAEIVIDRKALLKEGAHRIDRRGDGTLAISTSRSEAGSRPWVIENWRYRPVAEPGASSGYVSATD
ncbi:ComEC/Rec2 family competence protein [Rhodoligotrophos ferricapiens]|uniref:ComEC/Rec2 family competence protein n=1 Tax=Rhodoligotrophos ferricapiens TaxID=3069264 RepID=UPI00315D5EB8